MTKKIKNVEMNNRCYKYQDMLIKIVHICIFSYTIQCQIRKACHRTSYGDIHSSCYFNHLCILLPQLQHAGQT